MGPSVGGWGGGVGGVLWRWCRRLLCSVRGVSAIPSGHLVVAWRGTPATTGTPRHVPHTYIRTPHPAAGDQHRDLRPGSCWVDLHTLLLVDTDAAAPLATAATLVVATLLLLLLLLFLLQVRYTSAVPLQLMLMWMLLPEISCKLSRHVLSVYR